VEVNSSGKVTSAKLAAPVSSRYFSDHTLQAAKAWEFSPTEAAGQPAPSAWMLQFRIQRSGTQASADRISR
jgi:TonB family protein